MDTLSKKTKNDISNIKKPHSFVKKTCKLPWNSPNDFEKLHLDFSEESKEKRFAGCVGVFCQNLVYTLEIYSNFRNVLLKNGTIFEISDNYKTRKL